VRLLDAIGLSFALHHLGVLVADLVRATAFQIESFGYVKASDVIHDPTQNVFAQFLHLPGSPTFLELITPDGPESKVANALRKGGGLHHVCYATAVMDQACEDLRGKGAFIIQPPVMSVAFPGRRIAWLMQADRMLIELLEKGPDGQL
jgi:methylmalonyl-CoA/ethylmalonyl-CoA epimerase